MRVARLPEDGRCFLVGGDGLLESPGLGQGQGQAEVAQGGRGSSMRVVPAGTI